MTHMWRERAHHGCGPGFRRRGLSREQWLRRLEEYQKDLEQEVADVADLVRRLKEEREEEPTTV
jgi:hypothetical protein